jgi:formylmethanofuran dehydrogenase subunit D
MQHEGNVFEIPTQTDLELLIISGGRSHKPGTPRESHYSKEYLRKKARMNLPAHEYKQKGFREGTEVIKQSGRIIMRVPAEKTTVRAFNYGPIHESKKSVLKYAFLSAWGNIIDDIVKTYADEVR